MSRDRGRRQVPIPPNDQFNFFFTQSCHKFVSMGFVPQPNYTQQDVE